MLVVVQYTASMVLLCGTLIVFAQLNFMRSQSLGVKTNQTLVVKFPGQTEGMNNKLEAMKKAIARLPLVYKVTFSGAVPGEEVATFLSNRRTNDALKQNRLYEMLACDADYLDAYGLQLVAGRGFSEEFGDDKNKLVVNETSVRNLGIASNEEAIGEQVNVECVDDGPMQIIGVVKDYHQQALSKNYTPIMLIHKDKIEWLPQRYISIVMKSGDPKELVSQVEEIWQRYFEDLYHPYQRDGYSQSVGCFPLELVLSAWQRFLPTDSHSHANCPSGSLVRYGCLVEPLSLSHGTQGMVLCTPGRMDVTNLIYYGSLPDHEGYLR